MAAKNVRGRYKVEMLRQNEVLNRQIFYCLQFFLSGSNKLAKNAQKVTKTMTRQIRFYEVPSRASLSCYFVTSILFFFQMYTSMKKVIIVIWSIKGVQI